MAIGLAGAVIPVLPGLPVVYLGYAVYGFGTGWSDYGWGVMTLMGVATVMVLLLDYLAGAAGAHRFGASRMGMWCSVLGAIVGLIFFNLPGLILGPFVGAVFGELAVGRSLDDAFRSGWGAFLGFVAGGIFKFFMALLMIAVFLVLVLT
jgi:uncharacterized protein YqgC (DUF456 family)